MRVDKGIEMLEISGELMGRPSVIYPTLLWDEETVVLVDAGYPGQLAAFRQAIEQAGIAFERLNKIIVTHQDLDHIGSLSDIVGASAQGIEVLASEAEKPFIQGEQKLLRFTPQVIAQFMESLPAEYTEERRNAFRAFLEHPPTARVDATLDDGQLLPYCGGITVIATPGHTPGHICLYHHPSKTLIAGDALSVVDGLLQEGHFVLDMHEGHKSLRKLTEYDIARVITYHGGLASDDVNGRLAEITGNEAQ